MASEIYGKVIQIIKNVDKTKYWLPRELISTDKDVIVVCTNESDNYIEKLRRFFKIGGKDIDIVLFKNTGLKVGDEVDLRVKPFVYETPYHEIVEVIE